VGSLLGMAVGDALGLAYEGLTPRRGRRLFGEPDRYRLLPNRGFISDDTEHACMVAQALIVAAGDEDQFRDELARRLRWWLVRVPAGIGLATLRSILKLWVGVSPTRSGVFSAGNGPCMRSPLVGATHRDLNQVRRLVAASTRITHCDPRSESGAYAVALASFLAMQDGPIRGDEFLALFREHATNEADEQMADALAGAVASADAGASTAEFATELGLGRGVTGFVMHTVPIVIHAVLRDSDDFCRAVTAVIRCGGDTDTTGAIVGAIVGSRVGKDGIPRQWRESHAEWPQSLAWIERLGTELHEAIELGSQRPPPVLSPFALLARNSVFATTVLAHGFRRLLPPY